MRVRAGDIIVAIEGLAVTSEDQFTAAVEAAGAGGSITLTIRRNHQGGDLDAVVAER